jgi:DNA-directed RNA polymerase specialized sigma24 family protein
VEPVDRSIDERLQVEDALYRKLCGPVIKYLQFQFPEYDPEDMFHAAFVKVLRAHRDNQIKDPARTVELAITTARNEALSEYRRIRETPMPIQDRPVRFNDAGVLARQVLAIAKRLSAAEHYEEFLWYLSGLTDEEISAKRKQHPVTIRTRRFRLCADIRKRVNRKRSI